jgi:hypothetical protein
MCLVGILVCDRSEGHMSGGHWNYEDRNLVMNNVPRVSIPGILQALEAAFYEIDLAESNDACRKDAEPKVYDIIKKLGDDIFL